jgi:hypothetical protein
MHYDGDGCKEVDMQSEHAIDLAPSKASRRLIAAEKLAIALEAVTEDRRYQKLYGAPHFTSARKAWRLAADALSAWKDANK